MMTAEEGNNGEKMGNGTRFLALGRKSRDKKQSPKLKKARENENGDRTEAGLRRKGKKHCQRILATGNRKREDQEERTDLVGGV